MWLAYGKLPVELNMAVLILNRLDVDLPGLL